MLDKSYYFGFRQEDRIIPEQHNDIIHCVLVGLIIFSAATGCILGILTQFDITVNFPLICLFVFFSSMLLSFIHMSRITYIVGYFAFMFVFSYSLISMRTYANSGYQALLNIVNKAYSDHYLLSAVREHQEIYGDRYVTITVVSIFLGVFLVLLLNVGIFNDMFFLTTFNLTFMPLQFGIYIGRFPSFPCIVLLLFSYFSVYLLRHSGHFYFSIHPLTKHKRRYHFEYDDREGRHKIYVKSNARAMVMLCCAALIISIILSVFLSSAAAVSENEAKFNRSKAKTRLDESVRIIAQNGIAGLFNRYEAKGGINGGRLGGVRSVSPDYETDLKVTFVPYTYDTLYLRGYVGQQYAHDRWNPPSDSTGYSVNMPTSGGPASQSALASSRLLMEDRTLKRLAGNGFIKDASANMTVENVDAATGYVYTPYFLSAVPDKSTCTPASTLSGYSAIGSGNDYSYTPYSSSLVMRLFENEIPPANASEGIDPDISDYEAEVLNNYLQIPSGISNELDSYHDIIGTADTVQGQIDLIYDYFLDNYSYDFAPGATPYGSDFVTYFLGEQKRGYCAHFASAGAMLLRSYGIPARYIEGYVITATNVADAVPVEGAQVSEYYKGDNPLGRSVVVNADITDGNAHAWVEVFISGFGWVPVEFTVPASDDSLPSYADFLSSLAMLLRPSSSGGGNSDTDIVDVVSEHGKRRLFSIGGSPVFRAFILMLFILMMIPVTGYLVRALKDLIKRRRAWRAGDHYPEVRYMYGKAVKKLTPKGQPEPGLVDDSFILIKRYLLGPSRSALKMRSSMEASGIVSDRLDELNELTHKCFYSGKNISRPEADLLTGFYRSLYYHNFIRLHR